MRDSDSDSGINYMDPQEFLDQGFLQEVNRQFFHPRGLALEVVVEDGRVTVLGRIWDYRHDPEGIIFGPGAEPTFEKAKVPSDEWNRHYQHREEKYGWTVQPLTGRMPR